MDARQRELADRASYSLLDNALKLGKWDTVRSVIDKEKDEARQIELKKWVLRTICETNVVPPDDMTFLQDVINIPNEHGYTPLVMATLRSRNEVIIKLVENAADVTTVVYRGALYVVPYNALSLALASQKASAGSSLFPIELTSEAYAALIQPSILPFTDSNGNTLFHLAAECGNAEVVEMLIKAGADLTVLNDVVNHKGMFGNTPLHMAAESGNTDVIDMLKEAGADVAKRNEFGEIPLQKAFEFPD